MKFIDSDYCEDVCLEGFRPQSWDYTCGDLVLTKYGAIGIINNDGFPDRASISIIGGLSETSFESKCAWFNDSDEELMLIEPADDYIWGIICRFLKKEGLGDALHYTRST